MRAYEHTLPCDAKEAKQVVPIFCKRLLNVTESE